MARWWNVEVTGTSERRPPNRGRPACLQRSVETSPDGWRRGAEGLPRRGVSEAEATFAPPIPSAGTPLYLASSSGQRTIPGTNFGDVVLVSIPLLQPRPHLGKRLAHPPADPDVEVLVGHRVVGEMAADRLGQAERRAEVVDRPGLAIVLAEDGGPGAVRRRQSVSARRSARGAVRVSIGVSMSVISIG